MKKLLIAAMATSAMFATPAMADDTGETLITAVVPEFCELDAPATASVGTSGSPSLGTLYIRCNSAGGFNFAVASDNGFKLIDEVGDSTSEFTYTLTGTAAPLSGTVGANTNANIAAAPVYLEWVPVALSINITNTPPAYAGTYTDTLNWTITAN